ncbi:MULTISPECIES: polysaccharide deacetylase family protein [unclassified Bacillus (in: firmicutes)]|uniref:polysaccharide deacetylase family protein n=1 Tax=unclassified Bacillus (in: firmicutes) TaxID=185979 RepID=UPI0008E4B6BF|nr:MULTISPECIES: polysaccharide deacetylase family protein [unclassified Bacillus (in: firmicutes)]SFA73411.1 probable sporulation protein, polysaccharide deacetylase family [Bacillus sp. UNCCL13]SFQ63550.1 probable sporulation protein, polysaccharide deacetylase family [Bacillus sp. cl95]
MKRYFVFVVILFISWSVVNNRFTDEYVVKLKQDSIPVMKQNPLFEKILSEAPKYEVKPTDAKIDQVWKAMPGYNGINVDVKASYQKMKANGRFEASKLVFEQVKPKIHLNDLPPSPIYRGHQDKPMVSFIINVAWGNEYLPNMLAVLKKHKVHASFFLEGRWVKENPDLAKMIADAGHEIGNHSYTHPNMKQLSNDKIREQIAKTNEVIEATTGENCVWFAPPSGSYRDDVVKIADELNLGTVMWTVDTIDWQKPTPQTLISRVMGKIHNGAMVLMHPTDSTSRSLDSLLTQIKAKDLEVGTVSQLMDEERIVK